MPSQASPTLPSIGRAWRRLRRWPSGRWVVSAAFILGAAFFVIGLVDNEKGFQAFVEGIGAAGLAMVAGGVGLRFWVGGTISRADLPGGVGLGFDAAETAVAALNERMDAQMRRIDQRLYDLEKRVFKDPD